MMHLGAWDDIVAGRRIYYIFGDITYTDIFKEKHHTEFCCFLHSWGVKEATRLAGLLIILNTTRQTNICFK